MAEKYQKNISKKNVFPKDGAKFTINGWQFTKTIKKREAWLTKYHWKPWQPQIIGSFLAEHPGNTSDMSGEVWKRPAAAVALALFISVCLCIHVYVYINVSIFVYIHIYIYICRYIYVHSAPLNAQNSERSIYCHVAATRNHQVAGLAECLWQKLHNLVGSSREQRERFGAFGVPIFRPHIPNKSSLFNGEPATELQIEFPNHAVVSCAFPASCLSPSTPSTPPKHWWKWSGTRERWP